MKYQFPEGFFWGSAASAPQTEGAACLDGKGISVWDYWTEADPEKFWQQGNSKIACDFYHRYRDDIQLMKACGQNSYRLSIAWTRLFPNGTGEINPKGVEFYNKVIDELIANGIEPFVNLYHFDMPYELLKIGGWENRVVVDAFARYASACFALFGDRVKFWITHNEPIIAPLNCYMLATNLPEVTDFKRAVQVAHNILMSHVLAVREYRALNLDGQIGIVLNMSPVYPLTDKPEDIEAAKVAELFFSDSFLCPVVDGHYHPELVKAIGVLGVLPQMEEDDLQCIAENVVDYLGVNYYHPLRTRAQSGTLAEMLNSKAGFKFEFAPGARISDRGWEVYPEGVYDLLMKLKNNHRALPVLISENGVAYRTQTERTLIKQGKIVDNERIDFIKDHLKYVHKAIADGAPVFGYHLWTFLDCWSWCNGYRNVYGLVQVDHENKLKRTIKNSGYWFFELEKNNGFDE
ncbi:MAG: glycoside hydrolase family 1 protein [Negativicutes bacterium]|jgi:6-phospho-beta-glucosidase